MGGFTPLHYAALMGKPEMVQLLMLMGADKDALDGDGCTPLYRAAASGEVASALALLACGAEVRTLCGGSRRSVIHAAATNGHMGILRLAIENGADVSTGDRSQLTALHLAAFQNRAEAVDVLVEAGANIEARNQYGLTPLHSAIIRSNLAAVTALLKHGAHVNAQDNGLKTPLFFAARKAGTQRGTQRAAEVVDFLLRSGADETILDRSGESPADVVAKEVQEQYRLAEDVGRVRKLLANAPADRAWRRRGYLVLCRALPDRVQETPEGSSTLTGTSSRCKAGGGSSTVGRSDGEWAVVAARVLWLQEEGIFRTIVGFL